MANLLNNKYVVICLILAACGIVYLRAVVPAIEFYFPEKIEGNVLLLEETNQIYPANGDTPSSQENTERELQFASEQFKLTKIDIRNLRWNETPSRDPFTPAKDRVAKKPFVATPAFRSPVIENSKLPRVSAIVSSPELKFAVVEGEILKEGDLYGDFTLKLIEQEHVSVVQRSNNQWHKLSVME